MMGGSRHHDNDVPVTLVAQRDMVKREIEYYKGKCEALAFYTFITFVFVALGSVTYWRIFHG